VKQLLHLVRPGARVEILADRDWVVYLDQAQIDSPTLAPRGAPPLPPGPLTHDQLVALAFAADLVVTW
jgi:hypothetical protein